MASRLALSAQRIPIGSRHVLLWLGLCAAIAGVLGLVYLWQSAATQALLGAPLLQLFVLLALLAASGVWQLTLSAHQQRLTQAELAQQMQRLRQEIKARQITDAQLQAAKNQAEAASLAKTRYVAGMTHELRAPLNSILGYSQILLKSPHLDEPLRKMLQTMQHSGWHMHALINGALELAQIEAGRLRLESAPLPLPELVANIEAMLRPQAQAKGLSFVVQTLGSMPNWVRADAKRLRQILINLLSNALRFTERGEVRLRLDFRRHVARIDIIDSGIGIEAQDLERIFVPFERGSAGRRSGETGTGLGLTITHLLAELMGGQLSVTSSPGQGSTFTLLLYLPEAQVDAAKAKPDQAALHPVLTYLGPRRTLLVVDDQPLQRQLLAGWLVPLGFVVLEAASGRECLEIVRQQRPDLVLLDVNMDDLDGWQSAAQLRQLYSPAELPIVFVSATWFEHQDSQLVAQQCQGFVAKPIIESELLQVLERTLQLKWQRNTNQAPAASDTANTSPLAPSAAPINLPDELRQDLIWLAHSGQASALHQRLRRAHNECPDQMASLALLQASADNFDFDALLQYLRPQPEETA